MPPMQKPDPDADRNKHAEHHDAQPLGEVERGAEGMADKVADADKTGGPE